MLWAVWVGEHFTQRLRSRESIWTDARCDGCARGLGPWRQLPIVGTIAGCRSCGHKGPAGSLRVEIGALVLGAAAGMGGVPGWAGALVGGVVWGAARGWVRRYQGR